MDRVLARLALTASGAVLLATVAVAPAATSVAAAGTTRLPTDVGPDLGRRADPAIDFYLHAVLGVDMLTPEDGWVVGENGESGALRPWAARWDGRTWRHVRAAASHVGGFLSDVEAVSSTDIWAVGLRNYVGRSLIEHSTGDRFVDAGPSWRQTALNGVSATGPHDVWAVGSKQDDGLVAHWDGVSWEPTTLPHPAGTGDLILADVVAVGPDDVWAVGTSDTSTGQQAYASHWDGQSWSPVELPILGVSATLTAITGGSPDDLWAVGSYRTVQPKRQRTLAMHWDGSGWTVADTPQAPDTPHILYGVSAASTGEVWSTGGDAEGNLATESALVERWDGSSWHYVLPPRGSRAPILVDVSALARDDVWCVGYSYLGGGYNLRGVISHWDGMSWTTYTTSR